MLKIKIIVGSTRPQRFSEKAAAWIAGEAKKKGLDIEILDLRDYPLPFFNEAAPVAYLKGNYSPEASEVLKKWEEKIGEADGFIMTVAEYNHGYPAVLKNAIDYVYSQWFKKPVGYVSYGVGGGISSNDQLKAIATQLQMMSVPSVHIADPSSYLDEQGNFKPEKFEKKASDMLDQLIWWGNALKDAKAKDTDAAKATA
jgi:NAD(P)H-dependent FMN reductase